MPRVGSQGIKCARGIQITSGTKNHTKHRRTDCSWWSHRVRFQCSSKEKTYQLWLWCFWPICPWSFVLGVRKRKTQIILTPASRHFFFVIFTHFLWSAGKSSLHSSSEDQKMKTWRSCASKEKNKPVGELNLDAERYNKNSPSLRVCVLAFSLPFNPSQSFPTKIPYGSEAPCVSSSFTTAGGLDGGHLFGLLDQWVQSMIRLFTMM